ncbi:MAG: carboxymuconolactone decarboxylase family protein [Gammaproteobacteria bacterium]|nr:carboxymuconolactone decarboxylase family protein [Gammaproteobacteria bacterium]
MPEPHLNRIPRDELPGPLQALWDLGMQRTGEATIIEVFANHPAMLEWYFEGFYQQIFYNANPAMTVDVRTKELLRLKLSKQHGCYFCNNFNTVDALEAGITQAQIDNLLEPGPEHFNERDLAVIELAAQMMLQNTEGGLNRDLYARLRRYYDDRQLVEMGFVCAVLTGMAKFIFAFDLVTREPICPVRPQLA